MSHDKTGDWQDGYLAAIKDAAALIGSDHWFERVAKRALMEYEQTGDVNVRLAMGRVLENRIKSDQPTTMQCSGCGRELVPDYDCLLLCQSCGS